MFNPNEHMMNLKGKQYLQVMWRLVWFREECPMWNIDTSIVSFDENSATFMCKIYDDNGRQVSSGHGSESKKDFNDYMEKAETKAIGRALAILGYGTQFAPEMDEQERIVDSPVEKKSAPAPKPDAPKPQAPAELELEVKDGPYNGQKLKDIYKLKCSPALKIDARERNDTVVLEACAKIDAYIAACKK